MEKKSATCKPRCRFYSFPKRFRGVSVYVTCAMRIVLYFACCTAGVSNTSPSRRAYDDVVRPQRSDLYPRRWRRPVITVFTLCAVRRGNENHVGRPPPWIARSKRNNSNDDSDDTITGREEIVIRCHSYTSRKTRGQSTSLYRGESYTHE